jgi:hypothetical protein
LHGVPVSWCVRGHEAPISAKIEKAAGDNSGGDDMTVDTVWTEPKSMLHPDYHAVAGLQKCPCNLGSRVSARRFGDNSATNTRFGSPSNHVGLAAAWLMAVNNPLSADVEQCPVGAPSSRWFWPGKVPEYCVQY